VVHFTDILYVKKRRGHAMFRILWTTLILCLLTLGGMEFRASAEPHDIGRHPTQNGEQSKAILFFGDSLTAGYGIDPAYAFPSLIQEKIRANGWNFDVISAGVSGETTAGGLRRVDWVLQRPVDVFVLELGANDGLRGQPIENARANLQRIIDRVKEKYPQVRIVLAGMQIPANLGREYTGRFRAIFPELAQKNSAVLIPFLLEGVGGVPRFNLPDGIHPTPQGHQIVAENVWRVLEPVLREMTP
jgi:acyl-CoA thioesterase-1